MLGGPSSPASVRIFVAEAKQLLAARLCALCEEYSDLSVVGNTIDGRSTVAAVAKSKADVVLVDARMPDSEAVCLVEQVRGQLPDAAILLIAGGLSDATLLGAAEAGACGVISPLAPDDEVVIAILKATDGEFLLPRSVAERLFRLGRDLRLPRGAYPSAERSAQR